MKTAIIITGHMRSFDRTIDRLHTHVFSKFPGADFFVSTVQDTDAHNAELLRSRYPDARVEIEVVAEQPDCIADLRAKGCQLPNRWELGKPYMREKYWISVHPQAVARQLWQLEQGWKLFGRYIGFVRSPNDPFGAANNRLGEYGCVVRCRPDLWFHSMDAPSALPWRKNSEYSFIVEPTPPENRSAHVPWWGRFDGVNDRFAIMGVAAASAYFTTYSQIPLHLQRGGNLHPETLVKASLDAADCSVRDTLGVLFSTLRANGEIRPPEIIQDDLVHLAGS